MSFLSANKDAFTAFAAIIGLCTLMFAVWQYRTAQIWRRNEFLAKEMKDFLGDKIVQETIGFFDYWGNSFTVRLDNVETIVVVYHRADQIPEVARDADDVACLDRALRSDGDAPFSGPEYAVRTHVDHYFDYVERLCTFRKNRLFKLREMEPFIRYHVDLFNGMKTHSQGYQDDLVRYLTTYDYRLTLELLSGFPHSPELRIALDQAQAVR